MHSPHDLLRKVRNLSKLLYQDMDMPVGTDGADASSPSPSPAPDKPLFTLQACSALLASILVDLGVKYIEPRPNAPLMLRLRSQLAMVMATLTGASLQTVASDEVVPPPPEGGGSPGIATQTTLRALHQHLDQITLSVAGPEATARPNPPVPPRSWCL